MIITEKFMNDAGRNSPFVRMAMVQSGDKIRVKALKDALISIGACEITHEDVRKLDLTVCQKKYAFLSAPITIVLLDKGTFDRFKPIVNGVVLEIAHARNGLIGLLEKY